MEALFSSAHVADLVLLVMALEAVLLVWTQRLGSLDVLFLLLPGACLVAALRAALTQAAWPWLALCLSLAFAAHVADVMRRIRR